MLSCLPRWIPFEKARENMDISRISPSVVLRSEVFTSINFLDNSTDVEQQLLSEFTEFIHRGPLDDSKRLLTYLACQLLPGFQHSSSQALFQQSFLEPSFPAHGNHASKLKFVAWEPPAPSAWLACSDAAERRRELSREERLQQIDSIAGNYFREKGVNNVTKLNRLVRASVHLVTSRSEPGEIWNTKYDVSADGSSKACQLE